MMYPAVKLKIVLIILFLILSGCTNNPFFGGDDYPANRLAIKGNVQLQNASDNSGIYIWLEGVNAFTYTDSSGNFKLQLPSPESLPGGANAYSGIFRLYYFMSNYRFDSLSVILRSGEVEFGEKAIDANGNVIDKVVLPKLLSITTSISPNIVNVDEYPPDFDVTINIEPTAYGADVEAYFTNDNTIGAFIFARRDSIRLSYPFILPTSTPKEQFLNFPVSATNTISVHLPPGEYEIVPFLRIKQQGIPDDLVTSISEFAYTMTHQYLYVPIKINAQKLFVIK
ncbi:MAG: hypothetical protein H6627_05555 [Calditrichae bacterium]|nr:hypothetical protein [Calditrichota bacterium]MCB9058011.1 hypothetical protein [Calditrichia bacterium]